MKYSDEILMAYADGELDAQTRRDIETAIHADPQIAQQVAAHRALRKELQRAFDGVLDEAIPDRLRQAANSEPAAALTNVADFAAARARSAQLLQASRPARRWSWPHYMAIAASLLVGVMVGRIALQPPSTTLVVAGTSGLLAGNEVAKALSNQASGVAAEAVVQIGLSFRNRAGEYCRAFSTRASSMSGIACHAAGQWHIQALARSSASSGDYRMAGTALPLPILKAIEETIQGEPLDAAAEAAARARGWQD